MKDLAFCQPEIPSHLYLDLLLIGSRCSLDMLFIFVDSAGTEASETLDK